MVALQQKKKHVNGGGLLYGGISIENKHVKGGGLLYGGVSIEKNMLSGEIYYMVAFLEEKHVKGGGQLYGVISIEKKQFEISILIATIKYVCMILPSVYTYIYTLGFGAVTPVA